MVLIFVSAEVSIQHVGNAASDHVVPQELEKTGLAEHTESEQILGVCMTLLIRT